jgi:hypothetical protein
MKKVNIPIIATIIATFVISMIAFQPTTEASKNPTPSATPRKRRTIKPIQSPVTIQSPKPIQSPITQTKGTSKFFDAPKLDQDSGLELRNNRNPNQQRTSRKSKSKSISGKRAHKP